MTRIQDFYNDLRVKMDYDEEKIINFLVEDYLNPNPEYLEMLFEDDAIIIYDKEEGDHTHWSAIKIDTPEC